MRRGESLIFSVSNGAVCEGGQAAAIVAGACLEKTVRRETGQGQQSFCLGTDLQKKLSGVTGSPERPNLSGFQESTRRSGKKRKHSYMELKLQIPTLEEDLERTEGHSVVSCSSEPEVLQPGKGACSTEMKGTASLMVLNLQIPGLKGLGTEESFLSEPKPEEVVDNPENVDDHSLERLKKPKEGGKRYLTKKGRQSVKSELRRPRRSALLELHTQCVESKENTASLTEEDSLPLLHVQGLSGQEQSTAGEEQCECCIIEHLQSSDLQKGADSMQESAKKKQKKNKQDSGIQAVKKCKANLMRSENPCEKKSHFSDSPAVAALAGTQSKSFLCHPETKRSGVQLKKRKPRTASVKCLQNFSVTTAEKVINAEHDDSENSKNTLNNCNSLLDVTRKNPFVRLEDCSCINTFVKSSVNGDTSTFNLSGFFHKAQDKRKSVCPGSTVELSGVNCSTNRMQNERSLVKDSLVFNKEVKAEHKEEHFSCDQSENSKFSRGKKCNAARKSRKKVKITEMSAMQTVSANVANERRKCELPAEEAVASSDSSAALGLNNKDTALSNSYGCASHLHTESNTCEAQNRKKNRRKNSTKLLALEDGCKKTSDLSTAAERKDSNIVASQCRSATSGSLRAVTRACNVSNHRNSTMDEKLNKVKKKLQQFTCRRAIPMTGKHVWPIESCARTSEWVRKSHGSVSEGKIISSPVFEKSSDKSCVKTVGNSAVTGNLKQLVLHTSLAEVNKEPAHKIMDLNAECLTRVEISESSSVGIYETCRMSNENAESPVDMVRSAVPFNTDDMQEDKATSNSTTSAKDKGAVTKRNPSVAVRNSACKGKRNRVNLDHKASVVNQTLSDLKLTTVLSTGNLTNFKIPLRKNKPESRTLESVSSFESKTCSPPEVLDSTSVSGKQKRGEETNLIKVKQQPLPVVSDAISTASMKKKADEVNNKDFWHDGSGKLSDDMSALPDDVFLYPCPLESQIKSSSPDFCGTECVWKSDVSHHSGDAVDCRVALEIHDDGKSRVNLPQQKSEKFPDVLEAYNEDVLIIDVIQDDPDLFGTNGEEELTVSDSENCPAKACCSDIFIKEEKQYPECAVISENRHSVNSNFRDINMQESGKLSDTENSWDLVLKASDIKTHNSSSGNSPMRSFTEDSFEDRQLTELDELLRSFEIDEKFKFAEGVAAVEPREKSEAEKSDCKYRDLVNCEMLSELPLHVPNVNDCREITVQKSWKNDYRCSGKSLSLPLQTGGDSETWKIDKNIKASHSVQQILEMMNLPRKYCRRYFMTLRGCEMSKCWFWHVPYRGHEKICMTILKTYISINEAGLLKRAVQIFVRYYREVTPGENFAFQVLNDLLICLLKKCLLQEVFQMLNVTAQINTLPALEVLLRVFECVASLNIRDAVPALISTFCKLIDAGMFLEYEHFNYIIKLLHQLQVSSQEIDTVLNIKSRFQEMHFKSSWLFDFNLVMAEIQHCKEKKDWAKLGALYVNARTACEHSDDLQKLSLCITEILTRDSEKDRPGVPFCDFADAVIKNSQCNEADRTFIGRAGISVMNSYRRVLQWIKGRKVLDKLQELQIHFTVLKGLTEAEGLASRCQIVNNAAEIFLKTESLDGATWVLRESEWITNAPLWPCDENDILNRHYLLFSLMHKYMRQSLYRQAFEVLQNLPGFQNGCGTVDVSQYSHIFNKLLNACFESKNLGVSSSAVDFMLSKNIAVDFFLLRGLITGLGRSCLWSKARTYYKTALSLGCYPPLQGNLRHKILPIPFYVSEVEMLLAIELFLVSNASDIQSPGATTQSFQIILKRCEDQTVKNNSDYQAGMERLILAARISDPKLFLRHMTVNVNMEEVYSLELTSALKWLKENMKWAGKVWLFQ
ncbi:testis- and ovary-specific PAZ domain-containing protein 1 isoform X2 [Numida meleagris]|uniref:testis- and ovary-specific PAZ domain-containing protein 1 isoform X2 n=1 Tax=Numida meleagris TaxID=8996 RepID=UPI000B3DA8B4|nr:testis- and ovary-specific PAZ domain-containing protein 1 isoform X2 [Numida meleagris]